MIIYPPQHQNIRTEPGNQKEILAAVRLSELTGRSILQVNMMRYEVDEEVIYSQESLNMVEVYRDFDWELDRFVE